MCEINYFTKDKTIAIVGLGLIGASYAQGLSLAGYSVLGIARRQQTIDYALENKFISYGTMNPNPEFLSKIDILILALYPHILEQWIKEYQKFLKPGVIVTDVTGVKTSLFERLRPILRKDVFVVPSHPMAGREKSGIESADYRIFQGSNFIITPIMDAPLAQKTISEMATVLGFRKISILSPTDHDEMIGFLSQLTHCIAVSLMNCKESSHLVDYTGDSFRDLTRIAVINDEMWTELFLENKDELLNEMDLFIDKISQMRDALKVSDSQTLKAMMQISTQRRKFFDK